MHDSPFSRRRAFTLIDLLVAMTIIILLFALLVSATQKVRESANRAACGNNLRQLGIAFHKYHDTNSTLPTENGSNPSLYTRLLPYLEQQEASLSTPVKLFLCPSRRTPAVGTRRDYGYGWSKAVDGVGPSVLDDPQGLPLTTISRSDGTAYTVMLTHVWMSPATYQNGDLTDAGWPQKYNSRTTISTPRPDSDPTANNTYLGSPHPKVMPTLYADGHVADLEYAMKWPEAWAYEDRGPPGHWMQVWHESTVIETIWVEGNTPPTNAEIVAMLVAKSKTQDLTTPEAALLKQLSPKEYTIYLKLLEQKKKLWEQAILEKVSKGETLTKAEQQWYTTYLAQQKKAEEAAQKQKEKLEQKQWELDTLTAAKNGQPLTIKQQQWYDNYLAQQKKDQEAAKLKAEQLKWEQDTLTAGKNGQPLTVKQQQWYDNYLTQQQKAQEDAQLKAEKYQKQVAQQQWEKNVLTTVKKGEPLTAQEQTWYATYLTAQQQQQQQTQQKQQQQQQQTQNLLDQYLTSTPLGSSSDGSYTNIEKKVGWWEWIWVP